MRASVLCIVATLVLGALRTYGCTGFHAITTARGNGADSYVDGKSANANNGTASSLIAKGSTDRKSYFRFDISGIQKPLKFASLEMTLTAAKERTPAFYGLNDGSTAGGGHLGENWGETAITWNNAPGHTNIYAVVEGTGTANGGECRFLQSVEYYTTISATANVARVVLSGDTLLDFLNDDTDGLVTFVVTCGGTVDITWKSRENADNQPPRLLPGDATCFYQNVTTTADAHVDRDAPTSALGLAEGVIVRANNGLQKAYLRFDLTGIKRPILAASLFVDQSGTTQWDTLSLYGLNNGATAGNGKLGEVWADSEITANNAPANLVTVNTFSTGPGTVDGGQADLLWTTRIDTTGGLGNRHLLAAERSLLDFLNADTNDTVTIMMHAHTTSGTRSVRFATKENTTYAAPTLALVSTPPPSVTLIAVR